MSDLAPPVSRADLCFGLAPCRDPARGYRTFLEYSTDLWDPPPRGHSPTTGSPYRPNSAPGRPTR